MSQIREHQRELLNHVASGYGFYEISKVDISSTKNIEVHNKTITKGLFTNEERTIGFWCHFISKKYLPKIFSNALIHSKPIENTFVGDKYFLVLLSKKVYAFNLQYYKLIQDFINEIDYYINTPIQKIMLNEDQRILLFQSDWLTFIMAGIKIDNPEEEERTILSNKLAQSQPFFEFKAPIQINWKKLKSNKDEKFERICELLLQRESGIVKVVPIGKTRAADRGRDFEVYEKSSNLIENISIKWLVQCKFSKRSVSPTSISGWTDRVIEHHANGFWLLTNNDLTPSLIDQFQDVQNNQNKDIKVKFWQRSDFHIKLNMHSEILADNTYFKK